MANQQTTTAAVQQQQEKDRQATKVITPEVRLSFVHLWRAQAMSDGSGEPKFSVSVLIPKSNTELLKKMEEAIAIAKEQGKAKWGGKIPANLKLPIRDGDRDRPDNPEYKGHWFVTASSKTKPGLLDRKAKEITEETEVYSGMFGRVSINFYPFAAAGSKGIACGLNHVQKTRDGEALGGRGRAEDDFEPLEDDDMDEIEDVIGD